MKNIVLPFVKIRKKDVKLAGGKGASLGEMTYVKIPIPPGFVVLSPAADKFIKQAVLDSKIPEILNKVSSKSIKSVNQASLKIRSLIDKAKFPKEIEKIILAEFKKLKVKFVAVRSSATAEDSKSASWAGELETYLFVDQKNLIKTVKKCWSSLFTPRAIFYRFEKKLNKKYISVAVVIQQMVDSEIAGVCFTVHPVTKDKNQMVIEAGYGLGEAIVGGQVTPDTYVIDKQDDYIVDIAVSEQTKKMVRKKDSGVKTIPVKKSNQGKQKLTGQQIIELAQICRKIERHYKSPQDIEWAYAKGKFYITQSRPITTL